MSFKPNLQNITECTMNTAITAFHMQVTACPLIQLHVVAELEFNTENLSLLQGQQTESTKHYGPLPNGLACRLRNKEDEVHSGLKRNTKH